MFFNMLSVYGHNPLQADKVCTLATTEADYVAFLSARNSRWRICSPRRRDDAHPAGGGDCPRSAGGWLPDRILCTAPTEGAPHREAPISAYSSQARRTDGTRGAGLEAEEAGHPGADHHRGHPHRV